MNKNLILSSHIASNEYTTFEPSAEAKLVEETIHNISHKVSKTAQSMKQPIEWLRKYYSIILEKDITTKQTLLLLGTQAALVMAIFPANIHLLVRIISLGCFCYCLKKCKKSL